MVLESDGGGGMSPALLRASGGRQSLSRGLIVCCSSSSSLLPLPSPPPLCTNHYLCNIYIHRITPTKHHPQKEIIIFLHASDHPTIMYTYHNTPKERNPLNQTIHQKKAERPELSQTEFPAITLAFVFSLTSSHHTHYVHHYMCPHQVPSNLI